MEIKYEAVFGDQALFYDAQSDCEMVGNGHHKIENGIAKVWNFTEKQWADNYKQQVTIVAMRRIIRTPTWSVADQKAGKLPEVGAKFKARGYAWECVRILNNTILAVVGDSYCGFELNECTPIETPEEKAARLEDEWIEAAIYETVKRKETTNDEHERLKARLGDVYRALLSGELAAPKGGE